MATIKRFEDLEIWKMAREQAKAVFQITQSDKLSKDFKLKAQMNDSARSVMDCIAEGFERNTGKEFSQFLVFSKGSNGELRSQLYTAYDRDYMNNEILEIRLEFSNKLGRKLNTLIQYFKSSKYKEKPNTVRTHGTSNIQPPTSTSNLQPPTSNS